MKRNKFLMIIPILLILLGIGMIAYPMIENKLNEKKNQEIMDAFVNTVTELETETENSTIDDVPTNEEEPKQEKEENKKKPSVTPIDGVIKIPAINLQAPMKKGVDDATLNAYVGMYETTSKDFAALGTNYGIAAHSARRKDYCWYCYFDHIGELKQGDAIEITDKNGQTHKFEVTGVYTHQSKYSDYAYKTNPNEARITLVTCTDGDGDYRTFVTAKKVN